MTRDTPEQIDAMAASKSQDEWRARTEAAFLGQSKILEVAIGALIMTSPHPEVIKAAIQGALKDLKNAQPEHPALTWAPAAIFEGASASAKRVLSLHESVKARKG